MQIEGAIAQISENVHKKISLAEIGESTGLSYVQFIRRFKQAVGITPYSYVRNLRMSVVSELLQSGSSLTEASGTVGFKHPSSCCRALHSKKK